MTNFSDQRTGLKPRGSGPSAAHVVLIANVWLALVLIWIIWATQSAVLARGVAVLSVFHDLDAMERLATRVEVMAGGLVVSSGPPGGVLPGVVEVAK